jgi:hypothetical protein
MRAKKIEIVSDSTQTTKYECTARPLFSVRSNSCSKFFKLNLPDKYANVA